MPTITVGANTGNTYSGVTDTAFDSANTGTNYGTDTVINATKFASGNHQHSAVKFGGLSNITGPVTVSSATIWLNVNDGEPFSMTVDMRRLLVSFDESTANWNNRSTGTPWGTAGGIGDGTDREATVVASKAVDNTSYSAQGVYQAFTSSGLASLVEGWINGTTTNNGVHIERNGAGNDGLYLRFKSSNAADGSRPYLELTYAAGGAPTITGPSGAAGAGTSTANIAENATTGPTFSTDIALGSGYPTLTGAQAANWTLTALSSTSWRADPVTPFDFEAGGLVNPQTIVFNADAATSQTCTVTITNASEPPLAPTIGTATAGNASASVAFTPPSNTGRPAITGYTATSSPGGLTGTGASSPITVSGLTNGTAYTFTVTAANADGTGPASAASNSVTPSAGGSSPAPHRSFPLSILNH